MDFGVNSLYSGKAKKRTLSIRDKHILFSQSNGRCQNPYCKKKVVIKPKKKVTRRSNSLFEMPKFKSFGI